MNVNAYLEFCPDEDWAIARCRELNRGLSSTDPLCKCIVDGPGGICDPEWGHGMDRPFEANYAVVDLETARELLDDGESGLAPLIVTE